MSDPARQPPGPAMVELDVARFDPGHPAGDRRRDVVIAESPLRIQADGTVYTLLRTPGQDRELVVGFLYTEGLIGGIGDILLLGECPDSPNTITVRTANPGDRPRRTLVITSSCGLCGRDDIEALVGSLARVESRLTIPRERLCAVPPAVRQRQALFAATGSAHAAALVAPDGAVLAVREDVGRHNALDKLIGHALMRGLPMRDTVVFLSGRTSLELVLKAGRAGIPAVLAVGAPTDAAVAAADRLGITLCGFLRADGVSVYTHPHRIGP